MKRYLDPKNHLIFHLIFGKHPDVLRAMLNAVLPLAPGESIVSLTHLPNEHAPYAPLFYMEGIYVRCVDEKGRHFSVVAQVKWTDSFTANVRATGQNPRTDLSAGQARLLRRVEKNVSSFDTLFSPRLASGPVALEISARGFCPVALNLDSREARVRMFARARKEFEVVEPLIGLFVLDAVFDRGTEYFHRFDIVKRADNGDLIEGMQLVFIELPKFQSNGASNARALWLRFLIEMGQRESAPDELRGHCSHLDKAIALCEQARYSDAYLEYYDRCWDPVSTERTLLKGKRAEAYAEGYAKGRAEAHAKNISNARTRALTEMFERLTRNGMSEAHAKKLLGGN